jgi:hypothetical protein
LPPAAVQIIDSDATVSMLLGIFALLGLHLLAAVPAIILGNRSLKRIRGSGGMVIGEGRAKAGVTMGWISIAFMALALLGLAVFFLVAVLHR